MVEGNFTIGFPKNTRFKMPGWATRGPAAQVERRAQQYRPIGALQLPLGSMAPEKVSRVDSKNPPRALLCVRTTLRCPPPKGFDSLSGTAGSYDQQREESSSTRRPPQDPVRQFPMRAVPVILPSHPSQWAASNAHRGRTESGRPTPVS